MAGPDHYCTLDDVNALARQQPFTDTSVPSASDVEQFIEDIAVDIDMTLVNLGYVTPVSASVSNPVPDPMYVLRRVCAWGALGIAQDARTTGVVLDANVAGAKNAWTLRYETWKKNLTDVKNPYELANAQRSSLAPVKPLGQIGQSTWSTGSTVNPTGFGSGDGDDNANQNTSFDYLSNPPFTMGMKF